MPSKQTAKIVQNLEKKKFREKYHLFKVEGEKLVEELLRTSLRVIRLIALPEWTESHRSLLRHLAAEETDLRGMRTLSNFQSPPAVIALAEIPEYTWDETEIRQNLSLVLNGIQDPGNLGTILRVADWFGIRQVFCDPDCAHAYNPKCVQASMGAVFRTHVFYTDLIDLLKKYKTADLPVFGTFLDGNSIYTANLPARGWIVLGNEGKGIAPEIGQLTDVRLTVPGFSRGETSAESLNVGVAAGIVLSEFRRRNIHI